MEQAIIYTFSHFIWQIVTDQDQSVEQAIIYTFSHFIWQIVRDLDQSVEQAIIYTFSHFIWQIVTDLEPVMHEGFKYIFGHVCLSGDRSFILSQGILGPFKHDNILNKTWSNIIYNF